MKDECNEHVDKVRGWESVRIGPKALGRLSLLIFGSVANPIQVQSLSHDDLIAIAKAAIRSEIRGEAPRDFSSSMPTKPVFVTIEVGGKVVGCRGSLIARSPSLEKEVALEARAAAQHDPRYAPLKREDADRFLVTVTIVSHTEPIQTVADLQPCDGLVLESGSRKGIVLPWEGKDPKVRLTWAYRKAGVGMSAPVALYRLVAERFRG